ncbi:hypothetical protein BD413DRAFT_105183 [Trametes elegans]|nr:hypothetical protein BD413DRAFT_105183 [Trametes elegans]
MCQCVLLCYQRPPPSVIAFLSFPPCCTLCPRSPIIQCIFTSFMQYNESPHRCASVRLRTRRATHSEKRGPADSTGQVAALREARTGFARGKVRAGVWRSSGVQRRGCFPVRRLCSPSGGRARRRGAGAYAPREERRKTRRSSGKGDSAACETDSETARWLDDGSHPGRGWLGLRLWPGRGERALSTMDTAPAGEISLSYGGIHRALRGTLRRWPSAAIRARIGGTRQD